MNKVILMGRLTRDPEVNYVNTQNGPTALARYGIAVDRQGRKDGQQNADFINLKAWGKTGEFAEKYLKKGMMVGVCGRLEVGSYEDKTTGQKRNSYEVVVDEHQFGESKQAYLSRMGAQGQSGGGDDVGGADFDGGGGFVPIEDVVEDDLPF